MPFNDAQRQAMHELYLQILNGSVSEPVARQQALEAYRAAGYPDPDRIANFFVDNALQTRQQGVASGADWAKPPSQGGASYTATPEGNYTRTSPAPQQQPVGPVTRQQAGYLAEQPQIAWNRAFNLPSVGENPFQAWLSQQVTPTYASYAAQNLYDLMSGRQGQSFGDYLGAGDLEAGPGRALNTLRGLRGQQGQNAFLQEFRGEDVRGSLPALFQSALNARGFASPFARAAARQVPGFEEQWNTLSLGGSDVSKTGSLLDYLMSQFRI